MPQRARHSRQKSDDFKVLESSDIELDDVRSGLFSDGPSLSFRQPKLSCLVRLRRARTALQGRVRKITRKIPVNLTILSIVVLSISILKPIALGLVTVFRYPTVVDISLESFQIPSQIASKNQDAFTVAQRKSHNYKLRVRRSAEPWPVPPTEPTTSATKYKNVQFKSHWTIDLIYLAKGEDQNMFTVERLKQAQKIEHDIMKFNGFVDFCWKWQTATIDPIIKNKYSACTPPISLVDFFFPSRSGSMSFYDGQGETLTNASMHKTLTFLLSKQFTYWFVDGNFSSENRRTSLLRAQIKFGYPLKGYTIRDMKGPRKEEQQKKFVKFMVKFIDFLKTTSTDKVKVLYGGPEVYDYLVQKTMWDDINLAKYTLIIIIIFVFVLTSFSLFLTFFGILSILLSLPWAYFVFRVIFGIPNVTILSGASLFIIIGIGVDDVFVFINTFVHAKNSRDITSRLKHTVCTAGGATFFTSFTTAAAFGANCLSKMPAIHDFGLFMMLIVISCWLTVISMIPPTLFLWYTYIHGLEKRLFKFLFQWIPWDSCKTQAELPGDIQRFLAGNTSFESINEPSSDTDDVPPIELDDTATGQPISNDQSLDDSLNDGNSPSSDESDLLCLSDDPQDSDSAPLLVNSDNPLPRHRQNLEDSSEQSWMCGTSLQFCLFYYTKPVHFCRFVLLILYLVILGGSAFLDTKITPSNKPPSFFKEGSNLQQLLDLKYNMSGDNYDCKICDDIVEFASNFINSPTLNPVHPNRPSSVPSTVPTTHRPYSHTAESTRASTKIFVLQHKTTPKKMTVKMSTPSTQERHTNVPNTTPKPTLLTTTPFTKISPKTTGKLTSAGNGIPQKTAAKTDSESNSIDTKPTMVLSSLPGGEPLDPCSISPGCTPVEKPILNHLVTVNVVFGIKRIDRSHVIRQHVIQDKGSVVMDPKFTSLIYEKRSVFIKHMCRICNAFANNKELVRDAGADCFPTWLMNKIRQHYRSVTECKGITSHTKLNGKSSAHLYYMKTNQRIYRNSSSAFWFVMSFESTVNKGTSSKKMLKIYQKWDSFLKAQVQGVHELESAFHTSENWVFMYMEIIAVDGAIYGIVFSLLLCMFAVIIFTGHVMLSIIVILTIKGVLCFVVAIFYLVGWHLGAVEAISLSILVGTSVDYCVHLVDGYIISGRFLPDSRLSNKDVRGWRTAAAVSHIGSSIFSSAMTTIAASIPLCLTTIQLFSKFGQILAINTAVSIVYTLTFCIAFLTIMAPSRFRRSLKSRLKALAGIVIFMGMACLCLYIVSLKGTPIPGPGGSPIFDVDYSK